MSEREKKELEYIIQRNDEELAALRRLVQSTNELIERLAAEADVGQAPSLLSLEVH